MYSSMFLRFNVYKTVKEPGRMYLPGTLEMLTLTCGLPYSHTFSMPTIEMS